MNDSIYFVKDTVYFILKPLAENTEKAISFADYLTIGGLLLTAIGLIIALCQFSRQMKYSRESALKNQKENWYLSVIVTPQLDVIDKFYKTFIKIMENARLDITEAEDSMSNKEWKIKLAQKKNLTKATINETLDHLTALVRSYDIVLANEISNKVMELEDICTNILDHCESNDINSIRKMILENKQHLINVLNKGLTVNNDRS